MKKWLIEQKNNIRLNRDLYMRSDLDIDVDKMLNEIFPGILENSLTIFYVKRRLKKSGENRVRILSDFSTLTALRDPLNSRRV